MWDVWPRADLFLITTCSVLTSSGALVMGAGIAQAAARRFPGIEKRLGRAAREHSGSGGVYGLLVSPAWPRRRLGVFQTKTDWRRPSSLAIIRESARALARWLGEHPRAKSVHLNFPGIGHGGLTPGVVRPVLAAELPRAVTVWRFPS